MGRNKESVEKTYIEGYEFTKKQMTDWGVKFHKLIMGKPSYDIVIDDKHFNYSTEWISKL